MKEPESKKILAKTKNMKNYTVFIYAFTRLNLNTCKTTVMYRKADSGYTVSLDKLEVVMKL